MRQANWKAKDDADLAKELTELQREAFNLRMQKGTGQLGAAERGEGRASQHRPHQDRDERPDQDSS